MVSESMLCPIIFVFKKNISNDEKGEIALKLSKVKPPKKYTSGYPTPVPLAQLTLDVALALKLFDFVDNEPFQEMKNWVIELKVTNDLAERGVKLVLEFCDILTKDSEDLQNLLQVVEQHHQEFSDVKKTTLSKASRAKKKCRLICQNL